MKRRVQHRRAGVTLVELMLAAGVIATTMTALFGAAMTVTAMSRSNAGRMNATTATASLLEEISRMDVSQLENYSMPRVDLPGVWNAVIVTAYWENDDGYRAGTYLALHLDGEQDMLDEWEYQPEIPDDKDVEVNVRVYWRESDGRFYQMYSSLMAKG